MSILSVHDQHSWDYEHQVLKNEAYSMQTKYPHYHKAVPKGLVTIDVYRVLKMFNVTDQNLGHAIKKLLVAGGRGAGKDIEQDVREAIATLECWLRMKQEDDLSAWTQAPAMPPGGAPWTYLSPSFPAFPPQVDPAPPPAEPPVMPPPMSKTEFLSTLEKNGKSE